MELHTEFIKKHNLATPFLLVDLNILRENYRKLKNSLKEIEVFYAMKANDHPTICKALLEEGASFEVSSLNEAVSLVKLGVRSEQIVCFNPIKSPQFLEWMYEKKIDVMAFDSYDELDKIANYAPGSKVVIRILVPDQGSFFPLSIKFGAEPTEALELMLYAKKKGLEPYGVTFHVGSQCLNNTNWAKAMKLCKKIYDDLKENGITLPLISLGGGLPIEYTEPVPSLNQVESEILKAKAAIFGDNPKIRFTIEPGRAIIADAGNMVGTVVGKALRKGKQWIYLDVGVYNGLMEITGNFRFNIVTENKRETITTTVAGPSCDSLDVIAEHIQLPKVEIGDRVYILDVGTYSTVFASNFNGFEIPKTYFLNE